ncbi:acyl-CoA dehydrogenase family protein [Nocardioides sp.]|uniref:acyl-CoA dehydrogenase family protein n=1 Tax=Nocardioides sp. TaxID=35761 RepID=UPI0039E56662
MLNLVRDDDVLAVTAMVRQFALDKFGTAPGDSATRLGSAGWEAVESLGLLGATGGDDAPSALVRTLACEQLGYGHAGLAVAAVLRGAAERAVDAIDPTTGRRGDAPGVPALALFEGFGRSPAETRTSLLRRDGELRLVGSKVAIADAEEADRLVVVARDGADGTLRLVVVPTSTPGVVLDSSLDHPGLLGVGLRSATLDVVVSTDPRPVSEGGGADAVTLAANETRVHLGAVLVGLAQRAVEYAAKYATERVAFDRVISSFQGVSFPLAEAQIGLEAARLALHRQAVAIDRRHLLELDAGVSSAVSYAARVATSATRDAVQTLGGHGFINDHPVGGWYAAAATLAAVVGDPLRFRFEPRL